MEVPVTAVLVETLERDTGYLTQFIHRLGELILDEHEPWRGEGDPVPHPAVAQRQLKGT